MVQYVVDRRLWQLAIASDGEQIIRQASIEVSYSFVTLKASVEKTVSPQGLFVKIQLLHASSKSAFKV